MTHSGQVSVNIGNNTPTGPNPDGTEWVPCPGNSLRFDRTVDGTEVNPAILDRMLSVAIASYKSKDNLRVNIVRDSSGKCFTTQIYD